MLLQICDLLLPLYEEIITVLEGGLCFLEVVVEVIYKTLLISKFVGEGRVFLGGSHEVVSELLDERVLALLCLLLFCLEFIHLYSQVLDSVLKLIERPLLVFNEVIC